MEHLGTQMIETDRLILRQIEVCDAQNLSNLAPKVQKAPN